MNTIDELINDLSSSGKKVVSVKYITDRLRSIERHDNEVFVETLDSKVGGRTKRITAI